MKNWVLKTICKENIEKIHNEISIPRIILELLVARGIQETSEILRFLNPTKNVLHNPFLLKDMEKAVDRIILAIAQNEKILIFGDYDVDGISSSSTLYLFFKKIGLEAEIYIPSRFDEGYGLSVAAVDKIKNLGQSLIITVDCGIASITEVDVLNNLGMEIIITDHHQCQEQLPNALAVINPHRIDCEYPFKELCGAGVVYKLISALTKTLKIEGFEEEFLDITALGTVADIVPLVDENRTLVYHGLRKINKDASLGINILIETAGLDAKEITSYSIAYGLGPRINAAGRLGDAMRAVRLLTSEDQLVAKKLAMELNSENMIRQQTEAEILLEVIEYIDREHDFNNDKVIVAYGDNWHHGIIGIVASKIVERYYRPCILLCNENGVLKGSARSIRGFNIFDALTSCKELLVKYGGHEMAAGLTFNLDNLGAFKKQINKFANSILKNGDLIEKIYVDTELLVEEINLETAQLVKELSPFGEGNPPPLFICKDLKIQSLKQLCEGKHLKLIFIANGKLIDAIAFNMGILSGNYKVGEKVDILCSLDINRYNNVDKPQLIIRDIRLCQDEYIKKCYYETIDQTLIYSKIEINKAYDFSKTRNLNLESLKNKISENFLGLKKTILLVNDLESIKEATELFLQISDYNNFRINIGDYLEESSIYLYIIINPSITAINNINDSNVFIFGRWLDYLYLQSIVNSIDKEHLFLYNYKLGVSIFDREDIKAVYKYIWNLSGEIITLHNLDELINDLNSSYNRLLNAFTFRKCLEIFNEVGLVKLIYMEKSLVEVQKQDNKGKKVLLEDSVIYRKILSLLNE